MKTTIPPLLTLFSLTCFALLSQSQAVSPPPDGGYPGGNTAEGHLALGSLTTGAYNTAVGVFSLLSLTDGNFNTGVGAGTLLTNTAGGNTALGAGALLSDTVGESNTATGAFALFSNTEGTSNTANGQNALFSNAEGGANTAVGFQAASANTGGSFNTAIGFQSLLVNTTGSANTAIGEEALPSNTTGSGNIAIGPQAGLLVGSANNVIAIGSPGDDADGTCFIGNIRDVQTVNADAIPVLVDSAGQLGTASSSRRFKKEIKPMDKASEAILALNPVMFHYKKDRTNTPQFGLIAEEVAAANPGLVVRDKNGEIYSVRYDAVNAMLLNEFLKEHRKVQELETTVAQQQKTFESRLARQQKQIEALTSGLQKISAQIEVRMPAQQVAAKNP